jgi:DNA replication and repair protein RecF
MLTFIEINNFRWSPRWNFSLGENTSIIGPNGSGKSHILEAIHALAWGKMLYHSTDLNIASSIEWRFGTDGLISSYILCKPEQREMYSIQWKKVTKKNYFQELPFSTVYIGPFEMNLLYFTPNIRREYIDAILERAFEQFGRVKKEYEQVVKQRNALLKKVRDQQARVGDLDFWDLKHAELTEIYLLYRRKYIDFISSHLWTIADKYTVRCVYDTNIPKIDVKSFVCKYLQENRDRDILTGHTHIGPHRDDFLFEILQNNEYTRADLFLSRGEMKLLLIHLKQLEISFLKVYLNKKIILLIDDIFAELDEKNTKHVLHSLNTYQSIITSQRMLPSEWIDIHFSCIDLNDI